jgi:hypothetical protein
MIGVLPAALVAPGEIQLRGVRKLTARDRHPKFVLAATSVHADWQHHTACRTPEVIRSSEPDLHFAARTQ